MNRFARILGSTAFRLSLATALLLITAFSVAAFGVWTTTQTAAEDQARERILSEMNLLQRELAGDGVEGARAIIEARELRPGALLYRLTSPDGVVHAGDLPEEKVVLGWRNLDLSGRETAHPDENTLLVYTLRLADGVELSIGDDLARGEAVRAKVLRSLFEAAVASALVAVGIGVWVTRRALRRLGALLETMKSVSEGDMSARALTRAPARDDFDHLSTGINAMLDRISVLVANVRRVSMEVAHELRTPLTHVGQDLEIAAAHATPETAERIAAAQGRIEALLRTFDAMLRLVEIEAANAKSRFAPVRLEHLVERVTSAYRPDIEAVGGRLTTFVDAPLAIEGDADLLTQALANLIENAMVHAGPAPQISVACSARADIWELQVCDNGRGVAEPDREKILAPFARLDPSRSTPGAGLGLAIVASVAHLHNAEVLLGDAKPGLRVVIKGRRDKSQTRVT